MALRMPSNQRGPQMSEHSKLHHILFYTGFTEMPNISLHMCTYIYIYVRMWLYIYIYIYTDTYTHRDGQRERERERERERQRGRERESQHQLSVAIFPTRHGMLGDPTCMRQALSAKRTLCSTCPMFSNASFKALLAKHSKGAPVRCHAKWAVCLHAA